MIARFWDALFEYADKVKKEDKVKYEAVLEVESILQKAYDGGMDNKSMVTNWNPRDPVGKLVAAIPDIEVYRDPTDNKLFWELDDRFFDYPEEVIRYLIDFRTDKAVREMNKFKGTFLQAVLESIDDLRPGAIMYGRARAIATRVRKEKI